MRSPPDATIDGRPPQLSDGPSEFEARLRAEIDRRLAATPAMLHSIDETGRLVLVSDVWLEKLGYQREEVLGRRSTEFLTPASREYASEHVLPEFFRTGRCENVHYQMVKKGGGVIDVLMSGVLDGDPSGQRRTSLAVMTDITALLEAKRRLAESEARYRFLAENSTDLILLVGEDGRRLYASPSCRTLLGLEPEETIALRLQDAIHPDDAPYILPILAARPADTVLTYRMRRKDGGYVWVETSGKSVETAHGTRQRLIIVRDIEQRIEAEQRLRASEARYRLLAENATDVVFQLDEALVRRYVSPACREMLGYDPEELIGLPATSLVHPEDAPGVALAYDALMRQGVDRLSMTSRIRHKDGRWIWVDAQLRALRGAQSNAPIGLIGALRDISARKAVEDELAEANRRLRALAELDGLTGLANRRTFDETLAREYASAKLEDSNLALLMIDVDHFKSFNDLCGHPAGDDCLRRIGEAISRTAPRSLDLVARYGGEEFAVVLPATEEAGALAIALRIQQAVLGLQIEHARNELGVVTISAGVAVAGRGSPFEGREALLREADRALYLAKNAGRNTVILASSTHAVLGSTASAAA